MAWPLPASPVPLEGGLEEQEAPLTEVLIQLAMAEGKPEEVLKWYDHPRHRQRRQGYYGDWGLQVAAAVEAAYPDRAIQIWKEVAERHLNQGQVRGYEAAVPYLRQVKKSLTRTGRQQEWEGYLAGLREKHHRRPRCLQELDRVAGERRRIIDT